ncbi:type 1 glutamine amidotransferase [Mycolicibacterium moriokaense]|uniref:GMP synthase (Glutamine-hydrolysing) n=1 Tax=Mycolicibacterium moriokaense TaxID=39691 RepID=A0A318H9R9_9MYCO|nr:type 1 glutamine amidotransferase [Mycolicibacterium moriokaense]PXX03233.1 GMP synthase (glutamine-hydrolysing) [Mycolicibacterium moriokaense]
MTTADAHDGRPLLVVQHVPWEGPHLILDSFLDAVVEVRHTFDKDCGTELPDPTTVRGAIFMGGPMSVNDADTLQPIADEIAWLQEALRLEVPVLGICLGAQLLAKAAGAAIAPAPHPEIGVSPVMITDPHDPLIGRLAPRTDAMHWHGEQFTLPAGAVAVAHSAQTDVQMFRIGTHAWGMLFHLEVDNDLLEVWLGEPSMTADAQRALGNDYRETLRSGVAALCPQTASAVFDQFAKYCAQRNIPSAAVAGETM